MQNRKFFSDNPIFWMSMLLAYFVFCIVVRLIPKEKKIFLKICLTLREYILYLIISEALFRLTYDFLRYIHKV